MEIKHFNPAEFDSNDGDGSGRGTGGNMRISTLLMLDSAREIAGIPFRINSGFRTKKHNDAVGGSKNSSHMKGYAADIATDPETQSQVIEACKKAGFRRIGIYRNFVHVDNDPDKPDAQWRGGY
ncbi:D-Ala-D-Ala carboxypeptidase family metallohydrolase [Cecembia rubra]|uniref:Peptidase M15-like protein n=1 Tax=Cecembia rubra TaxID=1485585 RepID=A0A2P8EAP1_9BACT|nr:D-Ala-D-Ala carboxypeptidase family metallohydrolase [Cecembia rubra]PSL06543.1 peptidase M15-like protein [Cecembia rubra]